MNVSALLARRLRAAELTWSAVSANTRIAPLATSCHQSWSPSKTKPALRMPMVTTPKKTPLEAAVALASVTVPPVGPVTVSEPTATRMPSRRSS